MALEDVVFLHPVETVCLDAVAFQTMGLTPGSASLVSAADDLFENFVVCLSSVEAAWASGEFDRLASQAATLADLSDRLCLTQTAEIARQLVGLVCLNDDVALAAVVARAVRVGEVSLASILDFAYRRI